MLVSVRCLEWLCILSSITFHSHSCTIRVLMSVSIVDSIGSMNSAQSIIRTQIPKGCKSHIGAVKRDIAVHSPIRGVMQYLYGLRLYN